ncbi:MAG: phosphotransferase [Pseudomonadota bacterium]
MNNDNKHALSPIAEASLSNWPVDAVSIELVTVSENVTFKVMGADARPYVLRIHRPGYHTLDELKAEHVFTQALHDADIQVPRPIQTKAGEGYAVVNLPDSDETRHIGMYHWVEGQILADYLKEQKYDPALVKLWFGRAGELMARMHKVAETFSPDASFTRNALDADGTMGEAPFWGRFWDNARLSSSESYYLSGLRDKILPIVRALPTDSANYGMIHADLHSHNFLINGETLHVIDFDDSAFGWYQFDLAVALGSPVHNEKAIDWDALFAGYQRERPVPDDFFENVQLFKLVRALNSIGWIMDRPEHIDEDSISERIAEVEKIEKVVF